MEKYNSNKAMDFFWFWVVVLLLSSFLIFYRFYPSEDDSQLLEDFNNTYYKLEDVRYRNVVKMGYKCNGDYCSRTKENGSSLTTCSMTCGTKSQLWPTPLQVKQLGKKFQSFSPTKIKFYSNAKDPVKNLLYKGLEIFKRNVFIQPDYTEDIKVSLIIETEIKDSQTTVPSLDVDESYELKITSKLESISVNIKGGTYFGVRHGLETLSQLIWYDEGSQNFNILTEVNIKDFPKFKHRGVMVDTGRNYYSVKGLKRVLEGMAANKLNVFHWHITDSQSFPFDVPSVPEMAADGAYSKSKIYTANDIKEIVEFARIGGIKVIIEVDGPSHVNFGWNWGPDANLGNLTLNCDGINVDNILNPFNNNTLSILQKIYKDVTDLQTNSEMFHLGGDEVNKNCWNRYNGKVNSSFGDFWAEYFSKMVARLRSVNEGEKIKHVVIWNSEVTKPDLLKKYFDRNEIVIQFWLGNFQDLLKENFKLIFSTVSNWYLDCGFGKWRESKSAGCDKFYQWQKFYNYQPWEKYQSSIDLILGGEVCLWSEQVGEDTFETRLWPRVSAFAERIWSDPPKGIKIPMDVYLRLSHQRKRLLKRGLRAETVCPERCDQNPEVCP